MCPFRCIPGALQIALWVACYPAPMRGTPDDSDRYRPPLRHRGPHPYVEVRAPEQPEQPDELDDPGEDPMTRRRSRRAARKTPRRMTKSDLRTALFVGTVVVMTGLGVATYALVMNLFGQRDAALVAAGFVAGTLTAIVISPLILAGRERAARVISPRKTTSAQ